MIFRKTSLWIFLCLLLWAFPIAANQSIGFDFIHPNREKATFPIKVYHNLVVLKLNINSSDTLNFILDSGVENTILFSNDLLDNPLNSSFNRSINISGLGKTDMIEAGISVGNEIILNQVRGQNITIVDISQDIGISEMFGIPIHGIIGAELLKYFAVKIDYRSKEITLYKQSIKEYGKKYTVLPIEIHNNKPYIDQTSFRLKNENVSQLKMLVDLGESKPISIFEGSTGQLIYPDNFIFSNLGKGLSGTITGYITRSKQFAIDKYVFKNVITSYPDERSLRYIDYKHGRNGSIGSGLLKRFIVVLDYKSKTLALKRNGRLRAPFLYDRTGIIVKASGDELNTFQIAEIVDYTPAYFSELAIDDEILKINSTSLYGKDLVDVNELLNSSINRKTIRLTLKRQDQIFKIKLYLFDFI